MKDNIININLETSTAPTVKEVRGKDWIEYGTDDWANLYPQFLIDLYYNSSTHAAIINATSEMIAAEDFFNFKVQDYEAESQWKDYPPCVQKLIQEGWSGNIETIFYLMF